MTYDTQYSHHTQSCHCHLSLMSYNSPLLFLLWNPWLSHYFKNVPEMCQFHNFCYILYLAWGFPGGSVVKNPPANAGDLGSISGLGRSPGGRNDNPLQYSCLGNSLDRGTWQAIVCGVAKEFGHDSNLTTKTT